MIVVVMVVVGLVAVGNSGGGDISSDSSHGSAGAGTRNMQF